MPAENIFISGSDMVWDPDSDVASNSPHRLLRADNLVPDENNRLTLRRGSTTLLSSSVGNINVIYSAEIDGEKVRVIQIGDQSYTQVTTEAGVAGALTPRGNLYAGDVAERSGEDMAVCDDSYQIFWAREDKKLKYSKFSSNAVVTNWGLPTPPSAPTLTASAFSATTVADFGSTESSIAGTVTYPDEGDGGAHTAVTGYDGTSSGGTSLTPTKKTGCNSFSKTFTAQQDLSTLNGQAEADTDLFDLYCWLEEPRKVDKITIMFGMNTGAAGADPFITDYYYFDFKIKDQITVDVKDSASTGAAAYSKSTNKIQSVIDPLEVTKIKTPKQVKDTLKRLGRFAGPRSRERTDSQQSSPAWTHLSVTRGQFNRVGGTAGKDWSTITAFKVVYTVLPGSTDRIYLDKASWFGGGDRALTGTFRSVYRYVYDSGVYIEKGPPSPISTSITVTQGNITVTIPADGVTSADYANQIWVYLYGGFLDTFYRFAITASKANAQALRLDEWTTPDGTTTDTTPNPDVDYPFDSSVQRGAARVVSLSTPGGDTAGSGTIAIKLRKGELDVLIDNETLEPGVVGPPDYMIAAAGPWLNRIFCLDEDGFLWPSCDTSPSTFSVWWAIDLRRYGTPLWMVKTNGGILCGFTKDVIRIAGSGQTADDKASVDFYPEPLGVGQPPCDKSIFTDGNTVVYRSADGLVVLNGAGSTYLPVGNTSMLWRGFERHGVEAINTTTTGSYPGRFRMTIDNGIIYVLVPEGSTTINASTIYRYYPNRGQWCRTVYANPGFYTHYFRSIYREYDGTLLAGTTTYTSSGGTVIPGKVIQLGTDGYTDDSYYIPVYMLTPIVDGGKPLNRKHVYDAQLYVDTGGSIGTLEWLLEGTQTVSDDDTVSFATTRLDVYRSLINHNAIGGGASAWLKAQFRISGNFNYFALGHLNFVYHTHPQMVMALDSGYILPANPGDVAWIQELELDCIAVSNIYADVYVDDTLHSTTTITVQPNIHTVYRVQVPQGSRGRRPHVLFRSATTAGQGSVGFEPYGIRIRQRSSGNQIEAEYIPIYPVGQST